MRLHPLPADTVEEQPSRAASGTLKIGAL